MGVEMIGQKGTTFHQEEKRVKKKSRINSKNKVMPFYLIGWNLNIGKVIWIEKKRESKGEGNTIFF